MCSHPEGRLVTIGGNHQRKRQVRTNLQGFVAVISMGGFIWEISQPLNHHNITCTIWPRTPPNYKQLLVNTRHLALKQREISTINNSGSNYVICQRQVLSDIYIPEMSVLLPKSRDDVMMYQFCCANKSQVAYNGCLCNSSRIIWLIFAGIMPMLAWLVQFLPSSD